MKFRGLILAILVLVVLGGLLYWSNHRKPPEQDVNSSLSASPVILKMDQGNITQLSLARKGSAPVTLVKGTAGKWQIIAPKAWSADQDEVSGMLSTLSSLTADRVVEDKASDLKQYGLDDPSVKIDIESKDYKERKLLLGDDTPAGSDVYAMLAGDPRVFTIAEYNKTSMDKGLNDFRDKKLFDFGFEDPNKIELHEGAKAWFFTRKGTDWWSNGKKMDSAGVESLVENLRGLAATGFPDTGFSTPDFEVTVVSSDGKRVEKVEISKSGDHSIAKRENEPTLYQLSATALTDLTTAVNAIKPATAPAAK